MDAATIETANWWARPRGDAAGAQWIARYQASLEARHRTQLVEILREIQPETLLEVGAHCGPNLVRFAKEFPRLEMLGVDVSVEAVQAGRQWVTQLQLADRIQLNAGRVPDITAGLPSGSCDVVLSCYALAYIAPRDMDGVLYEMGRIATRAVILAEPMAWDGEAPQATQRLDGYSEWVHDYQAAKKWIGTLQRMSWRIVPVTPPLDRLNAIAVAVRDGS